MRFTFKPSRATLAPLSVPLNLFPDYKAGQHQRRSSTLNVFDSGGVPDILVANPWHYLPLYPARTPRPYVITDASGPRLDRQISFQSPSPHVSDEYST